MATGHLSAPAGHFRDPGQSGGPGLASRAATVGDLDVTGTLPASLSGALMTNGPAPGVPPPRGQAAAPGDDGMVHAVWLGGGRARYGSRRVPGAGRGIIRHAGHYLALAEGAPPQELSPDLELLGRFDFGGALPLGIGAHPRVDPRSGELVTFRSRPEPPFLTWAAIGPDSSVTQPPTTVAGIARPHLIHDFAITEHYLVFVLSPALLEPGAPAVRWRPGLGTRVALVRRSGPEPVILASLEPLWTRHLAGAFEAGAGDPIADADAFEPDVPGDGLRVVVDLPCRSGPPPAPGQFARITVNPARGTARLDRIGPAAEYPRIDDRLTGRPHRYVTAVTASGRPGLAAGEHDQVIRLDLDAGRADILDAGMPVGEVVFAPGGGPAAEEPDGWYLAFGHRPGDAQSWLQVWDAAAFPQAPVARVSIPAPVLPGQHAAWFPLHR
jgi:carotenoid cleavage dioxygenase